MPIEHLSSQQRRQPRSALTGSMGRPFDRQLLGIAPDLDADVAAGFGAATDLGRYIDRDEGGLPWPGRLLHVGSNTRCRITGGIKRPGLFKPAPQGRHRDTVLLGHGSEHNTRLAALLDEPGLEGRAVATAPVAWVEDRLRHGVLPLDDWRPVWTLAEDSSCLIRGSSRWGWADAYA